MEYDESDPKKILVERYETQFGDAKTRSERSFEARRALLSFVTAGNSGGALACLAVIGSALGRPDSKSFPAEYLWILLAFVAGLVCCWIGYVARAKSLAAAWALNPHAIVAQAMKAADADAERKALLPALQAAGRVFRWAKVEFSAGVIGGVFLLAGAVAGLVFLHARAL